MAKAEQILDLFCSLSAGSFAQPSLGHSSAEMPSITLSRLFVWAVSQAASSRNDGIFSLVCAGKIKCDLNSLLDLHQMSPPRARAVRQPRRGSPFPALGELSPPEQRRQHRRDIALTPSDPVLPESCPGCLPQKRLVAFIPPPPPPTAGGRGRPPLHAQGCASGTRTPTRSPASQGTWVSPTKLTGLRPFSMTSALGQLQDHEGLLGQLREGRSAFSKREVRLAKKPAVASRSRRRPPLGRVPWGIQPLAVSAAD